MEKITHNNIEFYKIKDFPKYYISKCGKVYSKYKNIILIPLDNGNGYKCISIYKNSKQYKRYIHRLVSEKFILNNLNKKEVNHINGIKSDNNINNLEWVSHSENEKHKYLKLKIKHHMIGKFGSKHHSSKKILQYDLNYNLIKIWESAGCVKRSLNFDISSIHKCCKKGIIGYHFYWEYV